MAHGFSCSAACGIFPDQGSNRVPCIGRRILNHCATREVPGPKIFHSHQRFFFNLCIYFWPHRVLVAVRGIFLCGAWALRCVVWGLLSSCGAWTPESVGSVVVACGILVPRSAIEPASPALEGGLLTTGPPGKSHTPEIFESPYDLGDWLSHCEEQRMEFCGILYRKLVV